MKTTRSELNWAIMGRMWSLERIGENGCGRMRASSRRGLTSQEKENLASSHFYGLVSRVKRV